MKEELWDLAEDRYFDPDPATKRTALDLYELVAKLPIISPHGHVDPRLFVDDKASFGSPADLLIIPDHYVFRMIYSQGVSMENMGVPVVNGVSGAVEKDHRKIWQRFADNFYLFRGTPSGMWLAYEFSEILGIKEKLNCLNAQKIYDQIAEKLNSPEFQPRRLFEKFNIEVLSTTDAAGDSLESHQALKSSGWSGRIIPAFRPDMVVNLSSSTWQKDIEILAQVSNIRIGNYNSFIQALENRRAYFKQMGAVATDHAVVEPKAERLSEQELDQIFQKALSGTCNANEATRFLSHMLFEFARMSIEDGLVMQVHSGAQRNHNLHIMQRYGPDKGADIPIQGEFTNALQPLLNEFGNHPQFSLILFTLDETTYARELAPIAGHYPAVKLGPPWWFHDSLNGMRRYFDQVMETAGIYNTAGFNDDTRAFLSIPARHDVWRRASVNWLAGLAVRGIISQSEAQEMAIDMAYRLPKRAYHLD